MKIIKAAELLTQEGIRVKCTEQSIHVLPEFQNDNINKLEQRDSHWVYILVDYERNSDGKEMLLQTFEQEQEAATYYFLVTLQSHYRRKYIYPFFEEHDPFQKRHLFEDLFSIKKGSSPFTISRLKKDLRSLQLDRPYYRFFEEEAVPHSIHLKRASGEEYKLQFIGNQKQVVFESVKLEDWEAYDTMFEYVYLLSLLDQKCKSLLENQNIQLALSDRDYEIFLS